MKSIKIISLSLIYLFLAWSSATVNIAKSPLQNAKPTEVKVCVQPAVIPNYQNKSIIVFGDVGSEAEVVLFTAGLKVTEWSSLNDYNQFINYKDAATVVDYYIVVESITFDERDNEKIEPEYFYRIIDAKTFKVLYSKIINTINSKSILTPFIGDYQSTSLSDLNYLKSFNDIEYNSIIDRGDNFEIYNNSISSIEKIEKLSNVGLKKKELNNRNTEVYLRCINAATSSFCLGKYENMSVYLEKAEKLTNQVTLKNNPNLENEYLNLLKSKNQLIMKAHKDSIESHSKQKPTANIQFKTDLNNKKVYEKELYLFLSHMLFSQYKIYDHMLVMSYFETFKGWKPKFIINSYIAEQIYTDSFKQKLWRDVLNLSVELKTWRMEPQQRRAHRIYLDNGQTKETYSYSFGYETEVEIRVSAPNVDYLLGSRTFKNILATKDIDIGEETVAFSKLIRYSNKEILNQMFYPKEGVTLQQFLSDIKL
jgi:hypothetical protein